MKIKHFFFLVLFGTSIFNMQAQKLKPQVQKAKFQDVSQALRDKTPVLHNDAVKKMERRLS